MSALGRVKKSTRVSDADSADETDYDYDNEDEEYSYESEEDDCDDEYEDFQDTRCGQTNENLSSLTQDQLLLCSASLKGYSLKSKKWRM